jgi:hypothetical protein
MQTVCLVAVVNRLGFVPFRAGYGEINPISSGNDDLLTVLEVADSVPR